MRVQHRFWQWAGLGVLLVLAGCAGTAPGPHPSPLPGGEGEGHPEATPTAGATRSFLPITPKNFLPTPAPSVTFTPSPSPTASVTPSPTTTPSPTLTPMPPGSLFGVQFLGGERNPATIGRAQELRVRWARVFQSWSEIEPQDTGPDRFNWQSADARIGGLVQAGFEPIVTIARNPAWAASTTDGPIDKPGGLEAFGQFVGALVERYDGDGVADAPGAPRVTYWEFYNEPDAPERWAGHGADYAAMLRMTYPAVHAANPAARVVFGGLAYEWWSGCSPCFDRNFLGTVVANAEGPDYPYFDVLNYHYYNRLGRKWTPPNIVGKLIFLENEQLPPNLRGMPVLCTEFGEPFTGEAQNPPYSHELASRYVIQGFTQLLAQRAWGVGKIIGATWFSLDFFNEGRPAATPRMWGLLNPDGTLSDEGRAFQAISDELADATFVRTLDAPGVEGYVFTTLGGGEKRTVWATGGPVRLAFPGSQVRVVGMQPVDGRWEWPVMLVDDGGPNDLDGQADGQVTLEIGWPAFVQATR